MIYGLLYFIFQYIAFIVLINNVYSAVYFSMNIIFMISCFFSYLIEPCYVDQSKYENMAVSVKKTSIRKRTAMRKYTVYLQISNICLLLILCTFTLKFGTCKNFLFWIVFCLFLFLCFFLFFFYFCLIVCLFIIIISIITIVI